MCPVYYAFYSLIQIRCYSLIQIRCLQYSLISEVQVVANNPSGDSAPLSGKLHMRIIRIIRFIRHKLYGFNSTKFKYITQESLKVTPSRPVGGEGEVSKKIILDSVGKGVLTKMLVVSIRNTYFWYTTSVQELFIGVVRVCQKVIQHDQAQGGGQAKNDLDDRGSPILL